MPGRIYAVAFNADGSRFAAGSSLDGTGEVRVYQTADAASDCRSSRASTGRCYTVAFSPDGKTVASAGFDGMVRLNDPTTGKLIKEFVAGAAEVDDGGEVVTFAACGVAR